MNAPIRTLAAAAMLLALADSPAVAQHLHLNHRWDECSIVLDPSLSQESWHQFVGEVGHVVYFRPLASAKPLGKGKFEVAILDWSSKIDDADDAWNDTFSHPDSAHVLFEGDALMIPGLMLRVGVTERVDVGAYYTKSVGANYGFIGGQVQYNLVNDEERNLAAAGRVSMVRLYGPEDMTASVYGADFLVSRDVWIFEPYAGVSGYLSRGKETTDKVSLDDENVLGVQGTLGMAVKIAGLRLGAEINQGKVAGYSFKIAFGS